MCDRMSISPDLVQNDSNHSQILQPIDEEEIRIVEELHLSTESSSRSSKRNRNQGGRQRDKNHLGDCNSKILPTSRIPGERHGVRRSSEGNNGDGEIFGMH